MAAVVAVIDLKVIRDASVRRRGSQNKPGGSPAWLADFVVT